MNKQSIDSLFQHCKMHKIFGTAGAGKTTFLINKLHTLFEQNVEPSRIAFVSFTNKAVNEITERCLIKFPQFKKNQFQHFRTIHSMCYQSLRMEKKVIQHSEIVKLAESIGMQVSHFRSIEDGGGSKLGDKVIQIESLARLKMIDLEEQWCESKVKDCPFFLVQQWRTVLSKHKEEKQLIDFTDMLEQYNSTLNVDYVFIDEAQDLCPLQWEVMHKATENCKQVYIAGDDDQSIFNWAGADVDYILNMKKEKETILSKSYRLPNTIYNLSRKILSKIKKRKPKECTPLNKIGYIHYVRSFDVMKFDKDKEYLILVRNRWQIKPIIEWFQTIGMVYFLFDKSSLDIPIIELIFIWEKFKNGEQIQKREYRRLQKYSSILNDYDINNIPEKILNETWYHILDLFSFKELNYIRQVLNNYYKLPDQPNIKISTIHQAKGSECDNVILFTDVSYQVWDNINTDNEHKVWYVAVTRTKENLYIIQEQTTQYYQI